MGLDIMLIWIPAHVGIKGNEVADKLAKRAISRGHLVTPNLPTTDIMAIANVKARNRSKRFFLKIFSEKGIKYFEHNLLESTKAWFTNINVDRSVITTTCRFRSGHYNSRELLFRLFI